MKWKLLGITYRQKKGKTSAIRHITEIETSAEENYKGTKGLTLLGQKYISMEAGVIKYDIGGVFADFANTERRWLIEEIKDWLGI